MKKIKVKSLTIFVTILCTAIFSLYCADSDSDIENDEGSLDTYSVTYNANGATSGSPPIDSTEYNENDTVTVLNNTNLLTMTGYSFIGWNTSADGSGTNYIQGQTFTVGSEDVTLYAIWANVVTYTVTYDGNENTGGSVPTDSTDYEQGDTVTVPGNTGNLIKAGSTFSGWNTSDDGSGTTYMADDTFTMADANVTLYAIWTLNPTLDDPYDGDSGCEFTITGDVSGNYELDGVGTSTGGDILYQCLDGLDIYPKIILIIERADFVGAETYDLATDTSYVTVRTDASTSYQSDSSSTNCSANLVANTVYYIDCENLTEVGGAGTISVSDAIYSNQYQVAKDSIAAVLE